MQILRVIVWQSCSSAFLVWGSQKAWPVTPSVVHRAVG